MRKLRSTVLLTVLVLLAGQLAIADGRTHVFTSTFAIPAALKIETDASAAALQLAATTGQPATGQLPLRVGTNDWPLDLHLGLRTVDGAPGEFTWFYQFVEQDTSGAAWLLLPMFSDSNPVAVLPSPAWTDYTLALRVAPPEDTEPGLYVYSLRVLLRSRSGKVESLDIPLELVVD